MRAAAETRHSQARPASCELGMMHRLGIVPQRLLREPLRVAMFELYLSQAVQPTLLYWRKPIHASHL